MPDGSLILNELRDFDRYLDGQLRKMGLGGFYRELTKHPGFDQRLTLYLTFDRMEIKRHPHDFMSIDIALKMIQDESCNKN